MPLNRFPILHPGRGPEQRQPGRVAGEGAQVHRRPLGARQGRHRRRTAADPGTESETILASNITECLMEDRVQQVPER